MRRLLLATGAALSVILLAGCPPSYPKCNNDDQCKEHNEVCVQGQCVECATDGNCKQGFVCQANKCVPKPECTTSANCPSGQRCAAGKCTSDCSADADCPSGKCLNGRCAAKGACASNQDCSSGEECQSGTCVTRSADACKLEPIHFEFDKASITSEAGRQLAAYADCIKQNHLRVRLEGHADERGTEEYNLQLSNRRAASTKKYLQDLGVPANSMDTTGFGFNRPAVQGHTDEAWAANRRVEFNTHP